MSYDIELRDPVNGTVLLLDEPHQMTGGTYQVGGSRELHLNITYNYGKIYCRDNVLGADGIRSIYGMTGFESISKIDKAASSLLDDVDEDYWKPTEGNAKRALIQLKTMAQMRPDGVWNGD